MAMTYRSTQAAVRILVMGLLVSPILSCASTATIQDVRDKLTAAHVGKTTDQLVLGFGPPSATFPMSGGGQILEWKLDPVAELDCKVRAVTNAAGIIQSITTIDTTDIDGTSAVCAHRITFN